jgi:simple sugar transport system permease protein
MFPIVEFIQSSIAQGTPLLFGATGEIVTEKSGNLNLGIPGIMYIGAISGVIGGFLYQDAVGNGGVAPLFALLIPFICSLIGSGLASLLYCFLTVTLRANQNVTGLALTTFGVGFGNFFGGSLIKLTGSDIPAIALTRFAKVYKTKLPFADKLGWFGDLFFSYGFMVYLAIICALVAAFILKRTRVGLHLRAVGESPATADAAGINVTAYKYFSTCIGGMIAGLGGLYYVMAYTKGTWANDGTIEGLGWLAVALVIFTTWKPVNTIWGAYLFGVLYWMNYYIPGLTRYSQEIFKMLPYLITIIVLIITSLRKKKEDQPPANLGLAYFREER